MYQAYVYSYFARFALRNGYLYFALDGRIIFPTLGFRDGEILGRSFQWSMNNRLDFANLGRIDGFVGYPKPLWVMNGLFPMFGFEARITNLARTTAVLLALSAPEKVFIAPVQVFERLLQHLGVSLFQRLTRKNYKCIGIVHIR